jgi:hypothetical protein
MIEDDFYIDNTKTIKHVDGATATYTILEFHRFLSDLADRPPIYGTNTPESDIDILSPTPSIRQTDNIIELVNGFRIDDETAKSLRDGSLIQFVNGEMEIYDGNLGDDAVYIDKLQDD